MPVPTPHEGERQQEFVSRCIGDAGMRREYSGDQLAAICYSTWKAHHKESDQELLDRLIDTLNDVRAHVPKD